MNSDGKKNEEAAANGRKMLWSVGRGQVDLYEPLEQRGKHAPQFLGTALTHSFCKTGVPTQLRLGQLFYTSSISFHQNSKASVSAQLAVKLIDFSCFSRSTSQ
ncbi:hypothetical protein E4U48_008214 [Claviceps purpurea]|nr:hypothetical protein E4U11_006314 [Claviceps purpurea]KAG6279939.1 hypothetical protein E4U48_008214 [Claviceps purpurea]